ncbi:hypothetical protein DFH09DRAFT_1090119 [Mycena vulgaris]|nr:hypothetical protein DFH09DRAFT_1090119 [Mycena vulgaris]
MESETKGCRAIYHGGKDIPIDHSSQYWYYNYYYSTWVDIRPEGRARRTKWMYSVGEKPGWALNPLARSKTRRGAPPRAAGGGCRVTWTFGASKFRGRVRRRGREVLEGSRGVVFC